MTIEHSGALHLYKKYCCRNDILWKTPKRCFSAWNCHEDHSSRYCINERMINTLRPRQDWRHFTDEIFTCIFFNENSRILIKFSLKYLRKDSIDNNPALVQIMAWRRSGDKPLSEPIMIILPTHICVTRPQWVNTLNLVYRDPKVLQSFGSDGF